MFEPASKASSTDDRLDACNAGVRSFRYYCASTRGAAFAAIAPLTTLGRCLAGGPWGGSLHGRIGCGNEMVEHEWALRLYFEAIRGKRVPMT
jgi:hypothetical protein